MHHKFHKNRLPVTALCMALVLVGCNGDSSDSGSTTESSVPTTINAQNATFVTQYADSYKVDLSDKVLIGGNGNDSFTLVDVTPLSETPECQLLGQSDKGFTVAADSSKSCDYQYQVESTSSSATSVLSNLAITRVAVVRDVPVDVSEIELNAISSTTFIEQTVEVKEIKSLLKSQTGFDIGDGFILSDIVTLPYSDNTATVNPINDSILYTPPSGFEGIERILFSYINDVSGEVLLGTLDIVVTQDVNYGFIVDDNITYPTVGVNEKVEIDISQYVQSQDDDDYQLIHVDSFNAFTAPLNDELDNKVLTFETSKPGAHYITFAVSDHNGAYAIGLIELYALDSSRASPWGDIYYDSKRYTGPLTTNEASSNKITYEGGLLDNYYNPPVEIALFTFSQAQNYCGVNGRLPTPSELQSLFTVGVQTNYEWPLSESYLASDGGLGIIIDMESGDSSDYNSGAYIVTCVNIGGLTLITDESSLTDIVANGSDEAVIVVQLTFDDVPVEGQILDISVPATVSGYSIKDSSVETDANGKATFYISSLIAQEFLVTINSNDLEVSTNISFVGDYENAVLSIETTTDYADTANSNRVKVSFFDINGQPLSGETVRISSNSNVAYIAEESSRIFREIGDSGVLSLPISWRGDALTKDRTVTITAWYDDDHEDNTTVTFTKIMEYHFGAAKISLKPGQEEYNILYDEDGTLITPGSCVVSDVVGDVKAWVYGNGCLASNINGGISGVSTVSAFSAGGKFLASFAVDTQ
ncbi:hypothetical protein AB6D68_06690 [Vibrio cyclitrophicus]